MGEGGGKGREEWEGSLKEKVGVMFVRKEDGRKEKERRKNEGKEEKSVRGKDEMKEGQWKEEDEKEPVERGRKGRKEGAGYE